MVAHTSANGSRETLQLPAPNSAGGGPDPLSIRSPRPTGAIFQAPLSRFSKPDNFALDTAAEEIARHIREFMR